MCSARDSKELGAAPGRDEPALTGLWMTSRARRGLGHPPPNTAKVRAGRGATAWPVLRPASNQEAGGLLGLPGKGELAPALLLPIPQTRARGMIVKSLQPRRIDRSQAAPTARGVGGGLPSAGWPNWQAERTNHTTTTTDRLSPGHGTWVITRREVTAHHLWRKPASHLVSLSSREW